MKRRSEPVDVDVTKGWPVVIRRNGRIYRVESMLDVWIVQGKWWSREERRVYFRVSTTHGIMDVYNADATWILASVED